MSEQQDANWPVGIDRRLLLFGVPAGAADDSTSLRPAEDADRDRRSMTLEQKLDELLDREELNELIARYAHRTAQGLSFSDMFTDDGSLIVRYPGQEPIVAQGRAALVKIYTDGVQSKGRPLPMIHNQLLRIRGDEAIGICSNELRWTQNDKSMIGSGFYEDTFRRENGRWLFVTRDMTFIHWVPHHEGWAKA